MSKTIKFPSVKPATAEEWVKGGTAVDRENPAPPAQAPEAMTKAEREDLQRLIRQREKVLKSAASQRSAELLAEFENQMAASYQFDVDETWADVVRGVRSEMAKANARIAERCRKLGIPRDFAPGLEFHWRDRGANAVKARREELRKVAVSRIEALEQAAIVQIELGSVQAQAAVVTHGLTSDAARAFVDQLPSIEALMAPLDFAAIAGDAEPPIVEQLVSPGALRQRRYEERKKQRHLTRQEPSDDASLTRQKASDDASVTPRKASDDGRLTPPKQRP